MSHIVDARNLASKLGVTPATILAWARRGQIPYLRAGRRPVLFDVTDVERAMKVAQQERGLRHETR